MALGVTNAINGLSNVSNNNWRTTLEYTDLETNSVFIIELPADTTIQTSASKLLAKSQIIDGVAVFERITRAPIELNFDFTYMQYNDGKPVTPENKAPIMNIFKVGIVKDRNIYQYPINLIKDFYDKIYTKGAVITLKNNYINTAFGIMNIILEDFQTTQERGSMFIGGRLKAYEDFYSLDATSLII
jgi:hypothetical protein